MRPVADSSSGGPGSEYRGFVNACGPHPRSRLSRHGWRFSASWTAPLLLPGWVSVPPVCSGPSLEDGYFSVRVDRPVGWRFFGMNLTGNGGLLAALADG